MKQKYAPFKIVQPSHFEKISAPTQMYDATNNITKHTGILAGAADAEFGELLSTKAP